MSETQERDERVTFSSIFIHWNPNFVHLVGKSLQTSKVIELVVR